MVDINSVLDPGERVIWEGKPKSRIYMLAKGAGTIIFGCVWLAISLFIGTMFLLTGEAESSQVMGTPNDFLGASSGLFFSCMTVPFFFTFFLIGIGIVVIPILSLLSYKNTKYFITTKRAILAGGLVGIDYKFIDFDEIKNISVEVGLIDKLIGRGNTGTISIFSGEYTQTSNQGPNSKNDFFLGIENPYEVVRLLKSVSYDIKTDIEYPNKLRPNINPGYQTDYKPENPVEPLQPAS